MLPVGQERDSPGADNVGEAGNFSLDICTPQEERDFPGYIPRVGLDLHPVEARPRRTYILSSLTSGSVRTEKNTSYHSPLRLNIK